MGILSNARAVTTLPVTDLDRAKAFYGGVLGLKETESPDGSRDQAYEAGGGSGIVLYLRGATKADHTVVTFMADDVDSAVKALREAGVVFEEYDIPDMGLKTVDGVAEFGGSKGAWFKDPDGSTLR